MILMFSHIQNLKNGGTTFYSGGTANHFHNL